MKPVATISGIKIKVLSLLSNNEYAIVEIMVIILWGLWAGRSYLNTSQQLWPAGSGLGIKFIGHHFWTNFQQCGLCALWDGSLNGGKPALATIFGSQFHPLVIMTTLLWGVIGGAKIAIVGCMALSGIAQWWLSKSMDLGRTARLFGAALAVVGGHLATKNDEGNFGIMLSTVACTLAIAAILQLARANSRRNTAILGLMGGMVLLSGQGYLQLALLFWGFAVLSLYMDRTKEWAIGFSKNIILSVLIGVLLAGILIIPVINFWPNMTKDNADPSFGFAQNLQYIPLNLVISDRSFFISNVLGKQPFTDLMYIGWIPVLLAMLSIRYISRQDRSTLLFLISGSILTMFVSSAIPLRWLAQFHPFFLGFRFTSFMTGLAVPPIIALAAYSLNKLMNIQWVHIDIALANAHQGETKYLFDLKWLLYILLFIAIKDCYTFFTSYMALKEMSPVYQATKELKTSSNQWVSTPFGEAYWVEPALYNELKLTGIVFSGSAWNGRTDPAANLALVRNVVPESADLVKSVGDVPLYRFENNQYASIVSSDGKVSPCVASGVGGDITVNCNAPFNGDLVVQENSYKWWFAFEDGKQKDLLNDRWLSIPASAGSHVYLFTYRPLDAAFGLLATLIGFVVALVLFFQKQNAASQ